MNPTNNLSYPADLVRRHERGRFLTALFAPPERREDLLALHAFALELAQVRHRAREPIARLIRLQWWRDIIDAPYEGAQTAPRHPDGHPGGHPVAEALTAAIVRHQLPHESFERVINGWESEMETESPPSPEALMTHIEKTSAPLASLGLTILGVDDKEMAAAAEHVAMAWGLVGALRTTALAAVTNRPQSTLTTSTLTTLAAHAESHITKARLFRRQTTRTALPLLLPATLADHYLKRLRRGGYNMDDIISGWSHPGALRIMIAYSFVRF